MSSRAAEQEKRAFFLKNFGRGILFLAVFIGGFLLYNNYIGSIEELMEPIKDQKFLVFSVYTLSEIFFGIITPEFFMLWALNQGGQTDYWFVVILLMIISYAAGWLNFLVGKRFGHSKRFKNFIKTRLSQYLRHLKKFGGFLLIVASVTPLPFAAICLLVGSLDFHTKKFALFTLFRFARFIVYGYLVWTANAAA